MRLNELVVLYEANPNEENKEAAERRMAHVSGTDQNPDHCRHGGRINPLECLREIRDAYLAARDVNVMKWVGKTLAKTKTSIYADAMERGCYEPDEKRLNDIYWHARQEKHRKMAGRRLGYSNFRMWWHELAVAMFETAEKWKSYDEHFFL